MRWGFSLLYSQQSYSHYEQRPFFQLSKGSQHRINCPAERQISSQKLYLATAFLFLTRTPLRVFLFYYVFRFYFSFQAYDTVAPARSRIERADMHIHKSYLIRAREDTDRKQTNEHYLYFYSKERRYVFSVQILENSLFSYPNLL